MAQLSGVTDIIATPHFRGEEQGLAQLPKILSRYRHFVRALSRTDIPVTVYPGAEILCLPQTPRLARQKELPTLADTNYLLVEFYFDESAEYMDGILRQICDCGYRLIVAHPERYAAIQRDPALADRWNRLGYALQLNKGSLLGAFGDRVQSTAVALLEDGVIRLIASDAHSIARRTTDMRPLRQWLSRVLPKPPPYCWKKIQNGFCETRSFCPPVLSDCHYNTRSVEIPPLIAHFSGKPHICHPTSRSCRCGRFFCCVFPLSGWVLVVSDKISS